jgi:hypothetical protein
VSCSYVFWDVGCIQNIQEHFFFQVFFGDTPRSEVYSLVTFEYLAINVFEGYSARSWAKETGKNSGK